MRSLKSIGILAIVLSFFLINISWGGDKNMCCGKEGGMGYFMIGSTQSDVDPLNARLQAAGFPSLSNNMVSLGGGGHGIRGRFIIGGEGHGVSADALITSGYNIYYSAGYGFFDVGYTVFSSGTFTVYPMLGIGGGATSLRISERGTAPSFNDIIDNPKRGVEVSSASLLLNLSVGTDYLFNMSKSEKDYGGFTLGLRIGYILGPKSTDWFMDETKISSGPESSITGPYIRFIIGGGGYSLISK